MKESSAYEMLDVPGGVINILRIMSLLILINLLG